MGKFFFFFAVVIAAVAGIAIAAKQQGLFDLDVTPTE